MMKTGVCATGAGVYCYIYNSYLATHNAPFISAWRAAQERVRRLLDKNQGFLALAA
jgi:hypothetical protein